jgi:hypothetical protein
VRNGTVQKCMAAKGTRKEKRALRVCGGERKKGREEEVNGRGASVREQERLEIDKRGEFGRWSENTLGDLGWDGTATCDARW